jgi:uncharacterized protein (TIGR03083 family)
MSTPSTSALRSLIDAWSASAQAVLDLVESLDEENLDLATDLPGWTVRDIVAHLAHLESELAGGDRVLASDDAIPADALGDPFRTYTEKGVAARRDRPWSELVVELEGAVARLRETLAANPPPDPPADFPRPGTSWEPLLRDRTVDYWMHEQDIRRAVQRPGGWDSPGAAVTLRVLQASLPFVVGKKVRPAVGTTVGWAVSTPSGTEDWVVRMEDDGRARPCEVTVADADASLSMSAEAFVLAGGGRAAPETLDVGLGGDVDLASRVLAAMTVTP